MKQKIFVLLTILMLVTLSACSATTSSSDLSTSVSTLQPSLSQTTTDSTFGTSNVGNTSTSETSDFFSDRDLVQTVDLATATTIELQSNNDVTINNEGVYVLSGKAVNVTFFIDAADDAKVQIVLNGINISNEDSPVIYVKAADKVFITTTDSTNYMGVSGSYTADGETNLDAVIFSKSDLTLNGIGTLEIVSRSGNGITSKDDLKITGGTYTINSSLDALEANDSILINDGTITINTDKDGLHSENDEDSSLGYIYIFNGTLNITAADDAIRGNSFIQIDGGTINIETCEEGIEANKITINDGQITLFAKNDGINAAPKVNSDVSIVVNGGTINLRIGSGDTDAFDSNGSITINGGTITVEATSAFDSDGPATLNGGDVTVNGQKITQITQSQPGGGKGPGRH
jgi:hypothetical protein